MPWPQNAVPRFGDWENNDDISYSVVFDKAREDKERGLLGGSKEKDSAVLHHYMLETLGKGRTVESLPINDRFNGQTPLGQQASKQAQVDSRHPSTIKTGRSRQPTPVVVPDTGSVGSHHSFDSEHYAGRSGKNAGISPGQRRVWQGSMPAPESARSRRSSESSRTVSSERAAVPKFGDWDAGNTASGQGFTVIFNKARDEKKSQSAQKGPAQNVSHLQPDEDLYTPSRQAAAAPNKKRGFRDYICCGNTN